MFPAASKSFERRTARAGGEQRRSLPAGRFARHHEAAIHIDIAALDPAGFAGAANGPNGFSIGLPESAFRGAGGEPICFIELPPENEAVDDGRLDACPDASAALTPRIASQAGRRTKLTLFASVALHVLAAVSLITWMQDDGALIAGGTPSEIAGIGNASTDQIASGAAVNVTITTIPIVKARPVETLRAVDEPAQPVEEAATAEPVSKTRAEAARVVETRDTGPAATIASQASKAPDAVQPQPSIAAVEADMAASVSDTPEILAAATLSDDADAAPVALALAEAVPDTEPVETGHAGIPPEEGAPQLAEHAPLPTPRPEKGEQPVEKTEKRAPEPEKKKPVRTAARTTAPGSGGRDQADAKR
ncbi:MAG: hypothetical protein L0I29_19310, partial [Hyphomicrobiales bacterium]|nr:hypothetical protein [Hyphomicrobiales bacterium]